MEETSTAGKTTMVVSKFILSVSMSAKKDYVIVGADVGTVEKNIINSKLGLLTQFDCVTSYHVSGKANIRLLHIRY